jgi:hypothetical protein
MTIANPSRIRYNSPTLERAERAVRCAPFSTQLYHAMITHSVSIKQIAGTTGMRSGYTTRVLSELGAETELLWLMQVGLLRREVDGQGLTDSFRITPLGRQLVEKWENDAIGNPRILRASLRDHLYNAVSRWLRWPF